MPIDTDDVVLLPLTEPATIDAATAGMRDGTAAPSTTSAISAIAGRLSASTNLQQKARRSPRGR